MIYDFNQRVHLRRDPSQYGRIGTTGQYFNSQDTKQAVFWEHEGADVVTVEPIVDLMSEQEYHERRRIFFSVIRRPEMHLVREALHQLKWDEDVDWRAMPEMELFRYGYRNDCCMILCGAYMLVCLDVNADTPYFTFLWLHDEQNASCRCEFCVMERRLSA